MKFKQILSRFQYILTAYESLVLALPLSLAAILVTINYALGLAFLPNDFIRYSNYTQEFIFFVLVVSFAFFYFKSLSSLMKVLISIPVLFFVISYIISYFFHGMSSYLLSCVLNFTAIGMPSYLVGSIVAKENKEIKLLEGINKWSISVLPLVIHFIIMEIAGTKPLGTKSGYLGIYTYMTIAYMILPFIISWFLNLLFWDESANEKKNTRKKVAIFLLILAFWLFILYAGTRGTILSVLFFAICLCIYSLTVRHRNRFAIVLIVSFLLIILLLGSFIPHLKMTRLSRLDSFRHLISDYQSIKNMDSEKKETTPIIYPTTINSSKANNYDSTSSEISPPTKESEQNGTSPIVCPTTIKTTKASNNDDTSSDSSPSAENALPNITSTNYRLIIYKASIQEIMNHPLIGLGPLGFYYKYYPQYPHNIFLELIVECGIFGGIASVYLIFSTYKLVLLGRKNRNIMLVFLTLAGYIIYYMLSGTVWKNPTLLFFLGYSVNIQQKHA